MRKIHLCIQQILKKEVEFYKTKCTSLIKTGEAFFAADQSDTCDFEKYV
jgi:hypothetical protein